MADGGEGTIDAVVQACHGEKLSCQVQDPLGREITAYYGCIGGTAVIEMAQASGLPLVMEAERDPRKTSTYGTAFEGWASERLPGYPYCHWWFGNQ